MVDQMDRMVLAVVVAGWRFVRRLRSLIKWWYVYHIICPPARRPELAAELMRIAQRDARRQAWQQRLEAARGGHR